MNIDLSNNNCLRVAFISTHGCPMMTPGMRSAGGMNVFLKRISPLLSNYGILVDIFTRSHHLRGPEVIQFENNSNIIHLPAGDPEISKNSIAHHLDEFSDNLLQFIYKNELSYDLIHSHYWLSARSGQDLAKYINVPHLFTFHTSAVVKELSGGQTEQEIRKEIELNITESANGIITFSEYESNSIKSIYDTDPNLTNIVPLGVDFQLFQPGDRAKARANLGLNLNDQIALFVGRLERFKGPDLLLSAIAQIRNLEHVKILFVGGDTHDSSFEWLKDRALELGISEKIIWHPAVPQVELPSYYTAANVCVIPSLNETFGLVALESMACKTPVICFDIGGLQSVIADGSTGYKVKPGDTSAMSSKLEQLLFNPALTEQFGGNSLKRAYEFSWENSARKLSEIYRLYATAKQPCFSFQLDNIS
ncbi:MAG: glycosyltransferase family 1 protein [SAR202 cluster bacterium]|nr:glycosyltransferase family 1 protein [SAR202 cluster bacterium]